MTHASAFVRLLREGPKTLGQIVRADGMRFCAEYRKIKTLLNDEGYDIRFHSIRKDGSCKSCDGELGQCPARMLGDACYKLHSEPPMIKDNGQMVMTGV